jgi:hypothetical protein
MIRSFVAWVLLFVLLAFLCGLIAAGPLNDLAYSQVLAPLNVVDGEAAKSALEQQFGTPLPISATDLYRANRGDEAYWLRLSVARDDMGNVFRGSSRITCRFPLQDRYRPIFEFSRVLSDAEQSRVNWWTPTNSAITAYVGGECTGSDYRMFRIFVDQTNSTRWTLYMEIIKL